MITKPVPVPLYAPTGRTPTIKTWTSPLMNRRPGPKWVRERFSIPPPYRQRIGSQHPSVMPVTPASKTALDLPVGVSQHELPAATCTLTYIPLEQWLL